jgi:acyl-coenzyme A thioesterase PaaI-like protein
MTLPIQATYPDNYAVCYGCGRLNEQGLHVQSLWDTADPSVSICRFTPKPWHTAVPGYAYGGLLASLIDCHATGTAAAAMYRLEGRAPGSEPAFRFVTGTLNIRYEAPTPIEAELELRAIVRSLQGRKVTVDVELYAHSTRGASAARTVRGEVVVFQLPPDMDN